MLTAWPIWSHIFLWLKHIIVQVAAPLTSCSFLKPKGKASVSPDLVGSKCSSVVKCTVCPHLHFKAPVCWETTQWRTCLPSKHKDWSRADVVASWNPCAQYSETLRCLGQAAWVDYTHTREQPLTERKGIRLFSIIYITCPKILLYCCCLVVLFSKADSCCIVLVGLEFAL